MRSVRAISSWSNSLLLLVAATASAEPRHRDTPAPHASSESAPTGIPAIARNGEVAIVEIAESTGDGGPPANLDKRFDAVHAKLQALHEKYDFVPMTALEVQHPEGGEEEHLVVGDGLDVEWKDNHLLVHPHGETKVLAKAGDKSWLAKPTKSDMGGMCGHALRLRGAWHLAGVNTVVVDVNTVVVDIEYRGTDSCWEPSGQWHVVSW